MDAVGADVGLISDNIQVGGSGHRTMSQSEDQASGLRYRPRARHSVFEGRMLHRICAVETNLCSIFVPEHFVRNNFEQILVMHIRHSPPTAVPLLLSVCKESRARVCVCVWGGAQINTILIELQGNNFICACLN
jgi:hypothetical protein